MAQNNQEHLEEHQPINVLLIESQDSRGTMKPADLFARMELFAPRFRLANAENLEQARHHLGSNEVDIVLLDLSLPDTPGLQALAHIQAQAPDVPVVVLVEDDEELAIEAFQAGAQDYIVRHRVEDDALTHTLICAVERHRMRNQIQRYIHELEIGEARFKNMIVSNPDGVVVVDADGMVRFVNPAALNLFGKAEEAFLGEMFGFPVVAGHPIEIDVLWQGSNEPGIAEMRVVQTRWEGQIAYLISLRDVTDRKRIEAALRDAEQFKHDILNSIEAHIVVIDNDATIITTNHSWNRFAQQHSDTMRRIANKGGNYVRAYREAFGDTIMMVSTIQNVLQKHESVELERIYQGPAEQEPRFFQIRVMPLSNKQPHLVISHTDITERKRAAQAEAEAQANATRVKEQEREISGLLQLSSTQTGVTAGLFGMLPLRESAPNVFEEMVRTYGHYIELALEQRAFKVKHDISDGLRSMAERLGFLRAGPRDVVDIHGSVLQSKSQDVNPLKAKAYAEEGRLMVLELMGYLVSYYRNYSLGMSKNLLHQ